MKLVSLTPNILVDDVVKTAAYYEDLLGMKILNSVEDDSGTLIWAMIGKDDVTIMLQERKSMVKELSYFENVETGGSLTFYLMLEGINELYQDVIEKVNIIVEMNETFYGNKEFTFIDMNGYVVTIAERAAKQ
jgi:uncharacterized glyoxalase superfamily protein PhnB